MQAKNYRAIRDHHSGYPEPITFSKGSMLAVGEKYAGPEGWDDWYFCEIVGQVGGWVPVQLLDFVDDQTAQARENYTARELDVRAGDMLVGGRTLNGWAWCENPLTSLSGWVPLSHLQPAEH
ncbi:MAG: SH3 domain-containing protein [Comamonas sp.]|uniref:SH3 domain-containing protein n=1 Tax=Comamonas sp. TaxID=34028 RepID=UPI002FC7B567